MNFIKYCLCLLLCSLFSIGTNQENRVYSQIPHFVSSLVYSPDGTMIAVSSGEAGCLDYTGSFPIPIYDASSGQPIKTLLGMNCTATGLSWSSDSAYLLGIRGPDSKIYIWNVVTDELELSFLPILRVSQWHYGVQMGLRLQVHLEEIAFFLGSQ